LERPWQSKTLESYCWPSVSHGTISTQGSITSPKDKPCPTLLNPWTDFPVLQQQLFETIYDYIPRDAEFFSSTHYLTELGQDICGRPLASEKDLEAYQRLAVERPATHIISYLQRMEKARQEFNPGEGTLFENHANTLSDSKEEAQQSLQELRIKQRSRLKVESKIETQIGFACRRKQMAHKACVWLWNTNRPCELNF